jgi:hypothetical protein
VTTASESGFTTAPPLPLLSLFRYDGCRRDLHELPGVPEAGHADERGRMRSRAEPGRLDHLPHGGQHRGLAADDVHVRRDDLPQVAADRPQLLTEIHQHLLGLPHRVPHTDHLAVDVERDGPGEKGELRAGFDDGGVGVRGWREEGGDGDAFEHGVSRGSVDRSAVVGSGRRSGRQPITWTTAPASEFPPTGRAGRSTSPGESFREVDRQLPFRQLAFALLCKERVRLGDGRVDPPPEQFLRRGPPGTPVQPFSNSS